MEAEGVARKRAFAVKYSQLQKWNVNSFFRIAWGWPDSEIKPLSTALDRRSTRLRDLAEAEKPRRQLTLHFDGSIEARDGDETNVTDDLFLAAPGDVVFSKIDVRNGAIGVVPIEGASFAVTSEYPVYVVRPDEAIPDYISLMFRTQYFRAALNSKISGHSGRKRINPSELEEVLVPLPSIEMQQQIVSPWETAHSAVGKAKQKLLALLESLDEELRVAYAESLHETLYGRSFAVNLRDLKHWDLKGQRLARFRKTNPDLPSLGEWVVDASETVDPRTNPDKDWPVYGVNNQTGVFLSHYQKGWDFNAPYKAIRKDWFFHNPTRANVGSLGIVPDVPDDAITSPEYQVWRIKQGLLPGFMATVLATPLFLELVQIHRVGAVKQRLFVENLREILIPSAKPERQLQIAENRDEILAEISAAGANLATATSVAETVITKGPQASSRVADPIAQLSPRSLNL